MSARKGRHWTLICCWENGKVVHPLWKTVGQLKLLNTKLPPDPAIALLGIYPREIIKTCTQMFIAALLMAKK